MAIDATRSLRVCDPALPNACAAGFTCRDTVFRDHRCARLCNANEHQCRAGESCSSRRLTGDGVAYLTCASDAICKPILDDRATAGQPCTYVTRSVCGIACQAFATVGPQDVGLCVP